MMLICRPLSQKHSLEASTWSRISSDKFSRTSLPEQMNGTDKILTRSAVDFKCTPLMNYIPLKNDILQIEFRYNIAREIRCRTAFVISCEVYCKLLPVKCLVFSMETHFLNQLMKKLCVKDKVFRATLVVEIPLVGPGTSDGVSTHARSFCIPTA